MHDSLKTVKLFFRYFEPSWLSSLVSVTVGVVVEVGAYALAKASGTALNQELFAVHQFSAPATTSYQNIANNLSHNQIISNLPLLLFWAGMGLVIYFIAVHIYGAFTHAYEVEQELHYVHANKQRVLVEVILRAAVRLVALGALIATFLLLLHKTLPYGLSASHTLSIRTNLHTSLSLVLCVCLLVVNMLLCSTFLRLLLLRPRIFSDSFF